MLRRFEPILSEGPYSIQFRKGPRVDRPVPVTPNDKHLTFTRRPPRNRYPSVLSAVIFQLGGSWHHTVGSCGCCSRDFVFRCVSSVPVLERLVPKVDSRTTDRTCHRGDSRSILLWFLMAVFLWSRSPVAYGVRFLSSWPSTSSSSLSFSCRDTLLIREAIQHGDWATTFDLPDACFFSSFFFLFFSFPPFTGGTENGYASH